MIIKTERSVYMHDDDNFKYISSKEIIDLSKKENKLLKILIENKDSVVLSKDLLKEIYHSEESPRTLDQLVCRLRKKLKNEIIIKNKNRFGYKIEYKIIH
jgi:DNA-binding response OmpR family regulator